MKIIDLWHSMVAKATEEEQALARQFHSYIEELDATVDEAVPPQEFPKWIDGVVVDSAEAEQKLRCAGPVVEPVPAPAGTSIPPATVTFADPPVPTPGAST